MVELIKKLKLDIWISGLLLIASLFLLKIASGFPETTALFPKLILYSILALCVLVIIESFKKSVNKEDKKVNKTAYKNAFTMYGLVVVYFILLKPLGFIISTLLFCMAGSWFLGSKSLFKNLAAGLAFNIIVYLAFVKFLNVPIPLMPSLFY